MSIEAYIPQIIATAIAIVFFSVSRYVIKKFILRYGVLMHKSTLRMLQVKNVIFMLLNIVLVFMLAIIWGVDPTNLLVGLSSVFAIIGVALFAQWSILSNITAGLIMFFSAPYRVGDKIRIIDKEFPIDARIENIQTFYTHIRTNDNELIVLPNNLFLQKIVSVVDVDV